MAGLSGGEGAGENPSEALDVLDSREAGGRIVRGGVLRFGSYSGAVALSVLSAALLTRYLGVVRFGQYTTILSITGVVAAVTDAGMASIGTREFAVRRGLERDALMRDLLGLRITLTLVGVALATAFAIAAGYSLALLVGTLLVSLSTVALVIQHTHTIPISIALRLGTLSLLDLARQLLSVVAIVVLISVGAGVLPLLAVALGVNLLLIAPTIALARNEITLRIALRPARWLALLRLTVSFSLATAVGTIYIYTAQIITSLVSTPHQSGLFAASFRVFIVVGGVPGLLVAGALPLLARAARDDRERLTYALQRIFEVSLILGVGASIGLLAGAKFIIDVVAGHAFAEAAGVLRIQGLAMIGAFLVAGWSYALLSLRLYRGLLLANAAAFLVSCGLTLSLAGPHGARGAALATVAGESVLAGGSLLVLWRAHRDLRPALGLLPKVLVAAVPGVAMALASPIPSLPCAVLALAVYALLLIVMRAVPDEVLDVLPSRARIAGR